MASNKQIQANRLNATKSTGPQSPEGKKRVAQNRLKHGLAGEHVVLANEDPSSFDNLLATLNDDWNPHSETEAFLVETLAYNQWRLIRIRRMEQASLLRKHLSGGETRLTMEVEDLSRYEGRSNRAYNSALNMLIKLQAVRQRQPPASADYAEADQPASAPLTPTKTEKPPANPPATETGDSNPIPSGESPGQPPLPLAA